MGTGASQSSRGPSPDLYRYSNANSNISTNSYRPVGTTKPLSSDIDSTQRTLVRTNQVAPIIIKNCMEEYQHVTDFKEPLVYDRITEGMPEHSLIMGKYFLVKDVHPSMDLLGTLDEYLAPNVRRARGGYPVYGMGQPSRDGLSSLMQGLKEEGFKDILLFNMRAEPVVFVRDGYDMIPFSLRHKDRLNEASSARGHAQELSEVEVAIRKQTLDLASLKEGSMFYFYTDVESFIDQPCMFRVAYEDDLAVTDEIYRRLCFNNSDIRYTRLTVPPEGAPLENDVDAFINVFRTLHKYLDKHDGAVPAMVFTSHSGLSRSTLGMVLGCLMLAHKQGFPADATKTPYPINGKSPNFERGEFVAVQQLVQYCPNGLKIKQEVDVIIDICDELHNVRRAAAESRRCLEEMDNDYILEGQNAKGYLARQCRKHVERYMFLIMFNAYLHDQYPALFSTSFKQWIQQRSQLYHLVRLLDISERRTSPGLLNQGLRVLVADDYLGLDVLSSHMDVSTSNFRRVPGMPIYGMAQPSREGLSAVVTHLLTKKQGHPLVVIINLREDVTLECDGATYSWRETDNLDEPIIMPGISGPEIEEKEAQLKKELKSGKMFQIYQELDMASENREFMSVLTPSDMWLQQKMQTKEVMYHRLPISDDMAPIEKDFDNLLNIVLNLEEIHSDEDGPAIVYHCRTGKGRTTTALAITGLIICHMKGFPYGTKPGEEERVSLPNADYTKGNFKVVQALVRRIPNGQQVKREVDFILDQCSDTMTPMHYHIREVIFVTYNKIKKAKTEEDRLFHRMRSLAHLERYIYLILFNTYLHSERRLQWTTSFSSWMKKVASKVGVYDLLETMTFTELDSPDEQVWTRRQRWEYSNRKTPYRGSFV